MDRRDSAAATAANRSAQLQCFQSEAMSRVPFRRLRPSWEPARIISNLLMSRPFGAGRNRPDRFRGAPYHLRLIGFPGCEGDYIRLEFPSLLPIFRNAG